MHKSPTDDRIRGFWRAKSSPISSPCCCDQKLGPPMFLSFDQWSPWWPWLSLGTTSHTLHGTSSPLLLFLCILLTFKSHHLHVWKIIFIEIISFEWSWLNCFKTILGLEKWPKRLRTLMLLQRPWLPFLVSTLDSSRPLYLWFLGTWHPLRASLSTVHTWCTYGEQAHTQMYT